MDKEQNYKNLRAQVRALGLYQRTYGYYFVYGCLVTAGFAVCLIVITLTSNVFIQILNAFFLGVFTVQGGMLGHDLSHNQVFESPKKNRFFGAIAWGMFGGMSESDWYYIHNTHHEHPNQLDHDPDIDIPFVFSDKQLPEHPGPILKRALPYQHFLFFLALPVLYITKLTATWRRTFSHFSLGHIPEFVLTVVHFAVLFYLLFAYLPLSVALAFLATYTVVVGLYMSFVFAPNHKGEEVHEAHEEITWLHQIISTRNLYPSWFIFHALGGLNYQIEHHLFPNLPRLNYIKVQPMVKQFCLENNIAYHETTWPGSMKEIYRSLKEVAHHVRTKRQMSAS